MTLIPATRPSLPTGALRRAAGMATDLPELRPVARDARPLPALAPIGTGNIPTMVWVGLAALWVLAMAKGRE